MTRAYKFALAFFFLATSVQAEWGPSGGVGIWYYGNDAHGKAIYLFQDHRTGVSTWKTVSPDGRYYIPYFNGPYQQPTPQASPTNTATASSAEVEAKLKENGYERAVSGKWPNLYKKQGALYFLDSNNNPIKLGVDEEGRVVFGSRSNFVPEIDKQARAYWNYLKEKEPNNWAKVNERLARPEYAKLAASLGVTSPPAPTEEKLVERSPSSPPTPPTDPAEPPKEHAEVKTLPQEDGAAKPRPEVETEGPVGYDPLKKLFDNRAKEPTDVEALRKLFGESRSVGRNMDCYADSTWKFHYGGELKIKDSPNHHFRAYFGMVRDGFSANGLPIAGVHADMLFYDSKTAKIDNDATTRNYVQGHDAAYFENKSNVVRSWPKENPVLTTSRSRNPNSWDGWKITVDPSGKNLLVCGKLDPEYIDGSIPGGSEKNHMPICCKSQAENVPEVRDHEDEAALAKANKAFDSGSLPSPAVIKNMTDDTGRFGAPCRNEEDPERKIIKEFMLKREDGALKIASSEDIPRTSDGHYSPKSFISLSEQGNTYAGEGTTYVGEDENERNIKLWEKFALTDVGSGKPVLKWTVRGEPPLYSEKRANWICEFPAIPPEEIEKQKPQALWPSKTFEGHRVGMTLHLGKRMLFLD